MDGNVLTYDGSSWSSPDEIDAGAGCTFRLVPDGELLRRGGRRRQCPHLRRQLVVVTRQHRQSGELDSVSCPTASFCAAVDESGYALTYDGSSWSKPVSIEPSGAPGAVSCPTASFCAAVDLERQRPHLRRQLVVVT